MNKDIIYIEPDEDITDILNRLKATKQKVVALVPPQKTGVLSSAVNIKLIAKTAKSLGKSAVIVTSDPNLTKLAFMAELPVAKTLQSRPMIVAPEASKKETLIDAKTLSRPSPEPSLAKKVDKISSNYSTSSSKSQEKPLPESKTPEVIEAKDLKSTTTTTKSKKKALPNFKKYQKIIIFSTLSFLLFGGFLVWALVISPTVKISVDVRATAQNFSENATFVAKSDDARPEDGKFLLEQHQHRQEHSIEFEATGEKNIGEKATGELVIYRYFKPELTSIEIPVGTVFTNQEMNFLATEKVTLSSENYSNCENTGQDSQLITIGCLKSTKVKVKAEHPGTKYNIKPQTADKWQTKARVYVSNKANFAGGTDKIAKIIQQSDIDKAKANLESEGETQGKAKLLADFPESLLVIESSFRKHVSDPVSEPKLGEIVEEGKKATLKSTTSFEIYGVDKVRIEEFIKTKSGPKIGHDQKIYSIGKPFFERFLTDEKNQHSAKLKTTIQVGPEVTEQLIMERSRGRKIGEVQSLIKSINGVSTVNIESSYFWVNAVPNDPNKITINLRVEE